VLSFAGSGRRRRWYWRKRAQQVRRPRSRVQRCRMISWIHSGTTRFYRIRSWIKGLAATKYPWKSCSLSRGSRRTKDLKDKAGETRPEATFLPTESPAMALPDVVKRWRTDIGWEPDLGNAVLPQQAGRDDAVQRMRAKAKDTGQPHVGLSRCRSKPKNCGKQGKLVSSNNPSGC